MTRSSWVELFWFMLAVCIIASLIIAGVFGFWWKGVAGTFLGIATVAITYCGSLAAIAYREGFGRNQNG